MHIVVEKADAVYLASLANSNIVLSELVLPISISIELDDSSVTQLVLNLTGSREFQETAKGLVDNPAFDPEEVYQHRGFLELQLSLDYICWKQADIFGRSLEVQLELYRLIFVLDLKESYRLPSSGLVTTFVRQPLVVVLLCKELELTLGGSKPSYLVDSEYETRTNGGP